MNIITTLRWKTALVDPLSLLQKVSSTILISVPNNELNTPFSLLLEHAEEALTELYEVLRPHATLTSYQVQRFIEKYNASYINGTPLGAIRLITGLYQRDDISPLTARERWAAHAPLANQVHIGCEMYVRNLVIAIVQTNDHSPLPYFGFTFQHYPSSHVMQNRMFEHPEQIALIHDDIQGFIKNYWACPCHAYCN